MTATIFTLKNANFNNPTLPNILPFVNQSNLDFAYDFKSRPNRLNDLTGRHADLVPIKVDKAANQVSIIDPSIITDLDGDGIKVTLGHLKTDIPIAPIDLGKPFTIVIVGGVADTAITSDKVVSSAPRSANLFDIGTGINSYGLSISAYPSRQSIGARIASGSTVLTSDLSDVVFVALTYDGKTWTLHNKTRGTTDSKTNTDIGVSNTINVNKRDVSNVVMGHYLETSTIAALPIALYQFARWNTALTPEEIDRQYQFSKNNIKSVNI